MIVDARLLLLLPAIAGMLAALDSRGAGFPGESEILSSFEYHPDIQIQLFAIEPQVVDPVALCFADNGDCFVVEMRDYPYGFGEDRRPGGTLRLLRDRDGDGRADESHLFANGLSYPTSVTPWRNGVVVVEPPRITFFADTDSDDRADVHRVILEGLELGVTDSNANGLRWGPDCRMHAANGGNGGTLTTSLSSQPPLRLANADFVFDPDSGRAERSYATSGGFGLVFHDWGQSFATYNIDYLQQRILPLRYFEDQPQLPPVDSTRNISAHGESARIYPIVQAVTRVNHPEQAGHFSSAGGMGILINAPLFGKLGDSIFICDVVCNIVHRDLLVEDGPVFRGQRAPEEQEREFIASRDPAFRPTGLEHGPDGALYLLDMQREVIEHPDYIPEKVLGKMDIRAGDDRGRIFRIVPKGVGRLDRELLEGRSGAELAGALASPKPWVRLTAQRLLFERGGSDALDPIREGVRRDGPAYAKVLALHLLHALGTLRADDLAAVSGDPHPGVRETVVRLAESLLPSEAAVRLIVEGCRDPHPRVRFQAALSSGLISGSASLDGLLHVLTTDAGNSWSRFAVLCGARVHAAELFVLLMREAMTADERGVAQMGLSIRDLAAAAAAGDPPAARSAADTAREALESERAPLFARALLEGLREGWNRRPDSRPAPESVKLLLDAADRIEDSAIAPALLEIARNSGLDLPARLRTTVDEARVVAADKRAEAGVRSAAIDVLSRLPAEEVFALVSSLLAEAAPAALQERVLEALASLRHRETAQTLLRHWKQLSPSLRPAGVRLLLSRQPYHNDLLDSLERGEVRVSELNLDLEQRRTLLRWSTPEVAERSLRFFGDEEYGNRKAAVDEWLTSLPPEGDPEAGGVVFDARCAACHQVGNRGQNVGPELTGVWHRSVEDLLSHIVDPNMAINPNYAACVVETDTEDVYMGLLVGDAPESVTLVLTGGARVSVSRSTIRAMRTLDISLMPEGLELGLSPQEMRSLIAFLQERQGE